MLQTNITNEYLILCLQFCEKLGDESNSIVRYIFLNKWYGRQVSGFIFIIKTILLFIRRKKVLHFVKNKFYLFHFHSLVGTNYNNLIPVVNEFLSRGENVVLSCSLKNYGYLNMKFPNLPIICLELSESRVGIYQKIKLFHYSLLKAKQYKYHLKRTNVDYHRTVSYFEILFRLCKMSFISQNTYKLIVNYSPKALVSTCDYFDLEFSIYSEFNKAGIKTYTIQHGLIGWAFYPVESQIYLCYGKYSVEELKNLGVLNRDLIAIGSPAMDSFEAEIFTSTATIPILDSMVIFSDTQGMPNSPKEYLNYKRLLVTILKKTQINIFVKLHPSENSSFYDDLVNEYPQLTILEKNVSLKDAAKLADICGIIGSTAGLEVMLLQKPLVVFHSNGYIKNLIWWPDYGGGHYVENFDDFERFYSEIANCGTKEIVSKQNEFIKDYFKNIGTATNKICDIIKN